MSGGTSQTLTANWKLECHQLVRGGRGHIAWSWPWSSHIWQARAEQKAGENEDGVGADEGRWERQRKEELALGRAGAVLPEASLWDLLGTQPHCCQAAQLPCLLTALLDIILLTYPFLGAIFHLELPMKMSCCGVLLGQRLPWACPRFPSTGVARTRSPARLCGVFRVCTGLGSRWFLNTAHRVTMGKARLNPSATLLNVVPIAFRRAALASEPLLFGSVINLVRRWFPRGQG